MITQEEKDTLSLIANHFGLKAQALTLLEEMSELQKEILKNINRKKDNIKEIIEETADLEIMLYQIKELYNIHKETEQEFHEKLAKNKTRFLENK